MAAITARWEPERIWLWVDSALTALLVHLVPAALLILYIHWSAQPPALSGSAAALDVELAALPPAGLPAASSRGQGLSQSEIRQGSASLARLAAFNPVKALGQMHSSPQPDAVPSNAAPVADAGGISAPAESSNLGASGASSPGLQLWLGELRARLESYKDYPSTALQQMQQDTVTLRLSVNHAGQVTYSRIDSTHHYPALDQEVQRMLRLAGSMPAPPPQLADDAVIAIPVQFYLDFMPNLLCGGSGCGKAGGAQSKLKAVAPPAPTLASCTAASSPGPAPSGSSATLEQMRAYRQRLNEYIAAGGNQLACLSAVRETSTLALRDTLARQLHSAVADFNAQARAFEAQAQAQAQQAQQARRRQAQALAAQVYGACTVPPAAPAGAALTAAAAPSFRRHLIAYQSSVRSYVACLQKAEAATAQDHGLASDQRAQLNQIALQLGNAAIRSFNQLAGRFNAQAPHLRQEVLAAQAQQQNLAEAVVRGAAIFPSSTWELPVPLPKDECISIIQIGQSYRAQLCSPTYTTTVTDLSQELKNNVNADYVTGGAAITKALVDLAADAASGLPAEALQQEAIAAQHGFPSDGRDCSGAQICSPPILGIAVTTQAKFAGQVRPAGPQQQTINYSVSELQVSGRRISMTISGRSDKDADGDALSAVHFDLVLSPDNQTLHGYCWRGQQRQECTLRRQRPRE